MKNKTILTCLTLGGWLALAAGCGKTEPAPPQTKESDKPTSAAIAAPTQATPTQAAVLFTQPSNAAAPASGTVGKKQETAVKMPDPVVVPVKNVEPKAGDTANPAAYQTQVPVGQAKTTLASLSQDQVVQGLEAALAKGLQQAIARLGHDGGFLTNVSVKIPMPEKLQKVENTLRAMKQDKLADDFVTTMNHAAEQAVPEAGSVFADALKQLTIEDAKSILSGPNDAATHYFQKATQTNLYVKFYPIVQKATEKTGVTAAYKNLMEKANVGQSLGSFGSAISDSLLGKDSMDIDAYVTNKALDGLFKMVAEEEQRIRQNPVARTTDILQRVFGALKK
jgi:hypothetical protein